MIYIYTIYLIYQVRQEKELTKITSQEGELPMILQKHKHEVKSLRQQIRRTQLNNSELQKKMNDMRFACV